MLENAFMMIVIIMIINIVYVSLSTLRVILMLKGRRYIAGAMSIFEIMIYTLGLGIVLDNLGEIQNLVAYGLGYGLGVVIGSKIEEKLALGYITVNVISSDPDISFTKQLRDKGYGVTSWYAYGMDGDRLSMQILSPRKYELHLYETIKSIDPKAFIIAYEPKQIHGGFWVKQVKRGRIRKSVQKAEEEQQQEASQEEVRSNGE
ncbi:DUF2179 domain-containing protein [Gracilibacillus sp. D59]|uniref:DUF2179 domain-containing protein n=1 Tax=Gracilibacillus sp. D59 TaxID=3457434 RepID=UPI003FCEE2A6